MKIPIIFFTLLLFVSCSSTVPRKIDSNEVSEQDKSAAFNFAIEQFESCTTGKYAALTTKNCTPHLVKSLTVFEMKNACEKINKDCGELQELNLQEILIDRNGYTYRYKAKYSATNREPEIRVYTNRNHKFDGIIYKPNWIDKYTAFNP